MIKNFVILSYLLGNFM